MDSEKENISIRAAESIFEFAQGAIEEEDLQQGIQTLEEIIKERG
jgi:F0F1-type ATP synthase delta subunit